MNCRVTLSDRKDYCLKHAIVVMSTSHRASDDYPQQQMKLL